MHSDPQTITQPIETIWLTLASFEVKLGLGDREVKADALLCSEMNGCLNPFLIKTLNMFLFLTYNKRSVPVTYLSSRHPFDTFIAV